MAQFNTGNSQWDQGLGTLAGALFPDPSKVAQAGYFGAQQRNATVSTQNTIDQMNARHYLPGMTPGSGVPNSPIMFTPPPPGSLPGMPPIYAPPSNLPMVPPPGPQGGAVSAQGPGAVPLAQAVPPSRLADAIAPLTQGGPSAPASRPTPSSPPAPNTTGSDGSVPTDDGTDSVLHPGSVMPPGGGVKYAAPAAANGSPAPPAINAGTLAMMMGQAGYDANQVEKQINNYIIAGVQTGTIPLPLAKVMLAGSGQGQMYASDSSARTSIATTGMQQATEREKYWNTLVDTVDEKGNKTLTPRKDLKPGQQGYDSAVAVQGSGLTQVQPDPNQPPQYAQVRNAPGQTAYNPSVASTQITVGGQLAAEKLRLDSAQVDVVDETSPTKSRTTTFKDARENKLQLTPKSQDAFNAQIQSAIVNAKTPQERQAIMNAATAAAQQHKPVDENAAYQRQQLRNNAVAQAYPPPDKASYYTDKSPGGLEPDADAMVQDRTDFLFNYSPNRAMRDYAAASAQAIRELQNEGLIEKRPDVDKKRDTSVARGVLGQKVGENPNVFTHTDPKGVQTSRLRVGLTEAGRKAQQEKDAAAASQTPSLANTVTPNQNPNTNTGGGTPIGRAPPNTPDGTPAWVGGQQGVVRGGLIYAQ